MTEVDTTLVVRRAIGKGVCLETLGDRLRQARDRKLWTQRDLAEATGIMEATISRIENGKHRRRPLKVTLDELARALGVSLEWLVFGEDTKKATPRVSLGAAGAPDRIRSAADVLILAEAA